MTAAQRSGKAKALRKLTPCVLQHVNKVGGGPRRIQNPLIFAQSAQWLS